MLDGDDLYFAGSAYDLAGIKALRTAAGDSGFTDLPLNDFEITFIANINSFRAGGLLFTNIDFPTNGQRLMLNDNDIVVYENVNGVTETLTANIAPLSVGDTLTVTIRKESGTLTRLTANGIIDSIASSVDIVLGNGYVFPGIDLDASTEPVDMIVNQFKIENV